MKKIEAIISPYKLADVKEALTDIGIEDLTITDVKGFGHQLGRIEIYRGVQFTVDFLPRVKIEIVLADNQCHDAIVKIRQSARTGRIGDGKILILPVDQVIVSQAIEPVKSAA